MPKTTNSLVAKLKILFVSSRPVSWINTAFPYAAGYLLAVGTELTPQFWMALLFFLIPYNMLIYVINDVFDYESDMRNPRKGGVEGAVLAKELHAFMIATTVGIATPFIVYLAVTGTVVSNTVLALIIFDALAYSVPPPRFKERPFFDSMSSGFHFVSPLLFALVGTTSLQAAAPFIAAFFLWGMASHAFGAVQDIIPDRQAGLASIATKLGARATARLSLGLYGSAVVLLALQGAPAIYVAIVSLLYCVIVWPSRNLSDAQSGQANKGWRHFMKINQLVGFVITLVIILQLMN